MVSYTQPNWICFQFSMKIKVTLQNTGRQWNMGVAPVHYSVKGYHFTGLDNVKCPNSRLHYLNLSYNFCLIVNTTIVGETQMFTGKLFSIVTCLLIFNYFEEPQRKLPIIFTLRWFLSVENVSACAQEASPEKDAFLPQQKSTFHDPVILNSLILLAVNSITRTKIY